MPQNPIQHFDENAKVIKGALREEEREAVKVELVHGQPFW
jgi:hypothetical protein